MIFKRFDVDNTDFITKENLIKAMKKIGKSITMEEVNEVLDKHDTMHKGAITFEEFTKMFKMEEVEIPHNFHLTPQKIGERTPKIAVEKSKEVKLENSEKQPLEKVLKKILAEQPDEEEAINNMRKISMTYKFSNETFKQTSE